MFGQLLGACSEQDLDEIRKLYQSDHGHVRMIEINEFTRVQLSPAVLPHPQIGLLKLVENVNGESTGLCTKKIDGTLRNCTFLFISLVGEINFF